VNQGGLKLISFSICPYVQRPRIVMLEKSIPHTIEYIDLDAPPVWFHELSPLEKVPLLVVGDQALFESLPICEYLDETSPGSLFPADPLARAQHRAWLEFGNGLLDQVFNLITAKDAVAFRQARAIVEDRLDILEEQLEEGATFFAGQDFGMVDVIFAPTFRILHELQRLAVIALPAEDTPKVAAWAAHLLDRPSVRAAVLASFPDDYEASLRRRGGEIARLLGN